MKIKNKYRHLGSYGLIIKNDKILLIKKITGPYDGKLDLPGGTIEMGEKPIDTLKREMMEEVGIEILDYQLFDVDSISFDWKFNDQIINVHHIGIFYKIVHYQGMINNKIEITKENDDSLGAEFYEINKLRKDELSKIAIMELEKLGYNL